MSDQVTSIMSTYGLHDESEIRAALDKLHNGDVRFIAFSGHLGSGKDTIADKVRESVPIKWKHEFFAEPLKKEVNAVIRSINEQPNEELATGKVSEELHVPIEQAEHMVVTLWNDVRSREVTTSYDRTPSTRHALQYWGTEVRRAQDEYYWVRQALESSIGVLNSGVSIYVTDARFVNELDAIKAIGGYIARLDVSTDVQAERIMGRDGTAVTDSMRNHISETAADHYDKFDIVLDTDHETPDELAKSIIEDMDRRSRVTGLPDFVDSVGGRYQFFTPKEVNDIEFPITTIMESYDSGEVDAYLAIIADVITYYENGRGREAKARLTANEVRDKEFPSRRFRKGYDAESVDGFLDQLAFTLSMYERYYDGLDDSATQSLTPDEQHELSKRIHELDAQS